MIKSVIRLACGILLLLLHAIWLLPLNAQQKENLHTEINRILRNEKPVDFSIVPSIAILTWDGDFMAVDTFGESMAQDEGHDYFEWGGLTQTVMAFMVESALQAFHLTPDSAIYSWMPPHLQDPKWKTITFRHLLDHRAGLPAHPTAMGQIEKDVEDPYHDFNLETLEQEMHQVQPKAGEWSYSNLGYAFLYWLFDPMEGIVDYANHIFSNTTANKVDFTFECNESCLTAGHGLNGKVARPWNTNAMEPAIGLEGNLSGLFHFIQLWRETYGPTLAPFSWFKKEWIKNDRAKTYLMYHGWFAVRSGKSVLLYHTGHTGGHQVSAAFLPKENKGVIIFSNGEAGSHDLCFSILTMLQRAKHKKH